MNAVREALREAGFDAGAVADAVGSSPVAEAVSVHARRADGDGRIALVRLFMLGETVRETSLPVPAAELEAAGLVERDGELVTARLRLAPFDDLLIAHDDDRDGSPTHVTGVNNASRTLASLTVRLPVAQALDVGTGCGIQALLAAEHAETVVAVDVNERALDYARLNASLNDASIDIRPGSWFEPVEGESFDLIVANPPFVISPDSVYVFRDSGLGLDAISREVVRGAAEHLAENGFATVLCNWVCRESGETWQPLEAWVEGTGCDALLLALRPVEPFHYASGWNEPLRRDTAAFSDTVERWLDYYESEGIEAIGIGAVVLRKRSGSNWIRGHDLERGPAGAAGGHVLRLFEAVDREDELAADDALLGHRFRLVPHRLDQTLSYREGYELSGVTITPTDGVGLVGTVDPEVLPVLFTLDTQRSLGEIAAEVEVAPPLAASTFRRLFELGFVEAV